MKVLVVDNHTKHLKELVSSLPGEVTVISRENFSSTVAESFDLVVLSGGSHVPSVFDHSETYEGEVNYIKSTHKPLIGICLGCEIICKAFGGELQKLSQKEKGNKTFDILDSTLKQSLGMSKVNIYECHTFGIKKIPEGFVECIRSDHGPELIRHKTLPVIGIQFHPEVGVSQKLWNWVLS